MYIRFLCTKLRISILTTEPFSDFFFFFLLRVALVCTKVFRLVLIRWFQKSS
jgi:hypothetical protein